jgi:transposase InsO family protein
MTVIDKYSKAVRFLPGRKDWSTIEWVEAVYEGVTLNGWGYPRILVSDRDLRFLSALWNSILELSGTRQITTTAYHPSADAKAERTNFSLEVSLRFFVNVAQDDWVSKLKVIEAQMNNAISASTKQAPNEILYGKKVRLDLTSSLSELSVEADDLTVRRETIRQEATLAIAFAQKAMKEVYD